MNKGIVYVFTNKHNNMQYFGRTLRPSRRFKEHLNAIDGSHGTVDYFHDAIREIGCQGNLDEFMKHFDFKVLDTILYDNDNKVEVSKQLDDLESNYIKENNSLWPNGYNTQSYSHTTIFNLTKEQKAKVKENTPTIKHTKRKGSTNERINDLFITDEEREANHKRRSEITQKAMQEYWNKPEQLEKKALVRAQQEQRKIEKKQQKQEYWESPEGIAHKERLKKQSSEIITNYNKSEAHRKAAAEGNRNRWKNGCPEETRQKFRVKARRRQCKELTPEQQEIYISIDSEKERREFKKKCLTMI